MMNIDEPVSITPYNLRWPQAFEKERTVLISIFDDKAADIQHIGSTAVVGLWAKPIIDIMVGLAQYPASSELIERLEERGYKYHGEAGVIGRQYFCKRDKESINLHLVKNEGERWKKNILLRDYLRANSEEADKYSHHKRSLISGGINSLLEYSEGKSKFIAEIIRRAEVWKNEHCD